MRTTSHLIDVLHISWFCTGVSWHTMRICAGWIATRRRNCSARFQVCGMELVFPPRFTEKIKDSYDCQDGICRPRSNGRALPRAVRLVAGKTKSSSSLVVSNGPAGTDFSISEEDFLYFRCGLGLLGVVSSLTLRVVPRYRLRELTFVADHSELELWTTALLEKFDHVRYHWLPHTTDVVVTCCEKVHDVVPASSSKNEHHKKHDEDIIFVDHVEEDDHVPPAPRRPACPTFSARREEMLARNGGPLDADNVKSVNRAEAKFWRDAAARTGELVRIDLCDGERCFTIEPSCFVREADSTEIYARCLSHHFFSTG